MKRSTQIGLLFLMLSFVLGWESISFGERAKEESTEELAKKTQNPVADLISIPFQSNFNFGQGPANVTQYIMNVQPVIPINLNKDWNLITRAADWQLRFQVQFLLPKKMFEK